MPSLHEKLPAVLRTSILVYYPPIGRESFVNLLYRIWTNYLLHRHTKGFAAVLVAIVLTITSQFCKNIVFRSIFMVPLAEYCSQHSYSRFRVLFCEKMSKKKWDLWERRWVSTLFDNIFLFVAACRALFWVDREMSSVVGALLLPAVIVYRLKLHFRYFNQFLFLTRRLFLLHSSSSV